MPYDRNKTIKRLRREMQAERRKNQWPVAIEFLEESIEIAKRRLDIRILSDTKTPEYAAWWGVLNRIDNPLAVGYKNFGGVGITASDAWRSYDVFLADMKARPSVDHYLDIWPDQLGVFRKGNARWASYEEKIESEAKKKSAILKKQEIESIREWKRQHSMPLLDE